MASLPLKRFLVSGLCKYGLMISEHDNVTQWKSDPSLICSTTGSFCMVDRRAYSNKLWVAHSR